MKIPHAGAVNLLMCVDSSTNTKNLKSLRYFLFCTKNLKSLRYFLFCIFLHFTCRVWRVACHLSHVTCHVSSVTRQYSLTPTATAANSPTMDSNLVCKDPKTQRGFKTLKIVKTFPPKKFPLVSQYKQYTLQPKVSSLKEGTHNSPRTWRLIDLIGLGADAVKMHTDNVEELGQTLSE